ncbi:hypothetical protein [Spirosoma utsteinense]|uniref:Prevent-host-death protein n=1 Tax=Spirosoma utsteinense TaxID=2585773 RepID=A0ABR6W555_9BACT|nr:hypothetical protein [Spirosoma utsteinense]MBC3785589.1 hypothetical protein [Spirosoma utsteinense]MBC3791738.1 hypothetical protein [Spirosoma utsteinense]
MNVQYLSDAQGRHTAIVIPIEEWNSITAKHEDLKTLEKPMQPTIQPKPSDFRGSISKKTADELLRYTEQARTEWGNTIS